MPAKRQRVDRGPAAARDVCDAQPHQPQHARARARERACRPRRADRSSARTARCGRTSAARDSAARSSTAAPIEWPSANSGGGQSGSTTSFTNASRSRSYSEKSSTCPLRAFGSARSREALPAPVEDRDREAARARIAHHLEIFLDELGAAREHAQRPLASGRRREAGKAQHAPRPGSSRFRRSRLREPDWRGSRSSCMGNRAGLPAL